MTVLPMPEQVQWAWDARGEGRAVRVSAHGETGLLNLSLWRGDFCVGTVRLPPDEASRLVSGLTAGLARIAQDALLSVTRRDGEGEPGAGRLREVEQRLVALELRAQPAQRRGVEPLARELAGQLRTWRRRWSGRNG